MCCPFESKMIILPSSGVQFVDNFIAQTKISIQSITDCRGVTWVEDHVYVCGSDSNDDGRIIILDSNGQHISSISSISSIGIYFELPCVYKV
jgi:hypothetical protein